MSDSRKNVNTFSPEGRLYQIEYAMKASNLGTTTLGLIIGDKGILISEKKVVNKFQIKDSVKKHHKVFDHIVIGASGISADAKSIVDKSRDYALYHHRIYNENVPVESMLKHLCSLALKFGEKDYSRKIFSRPFGSSILTISYENEPKLYLFDPSGSYRRYNAKVLGNATQVLENELENKYSLMKEFDSGLLESLKIFKEVMRDPMSKENVEISVVCKDGVKFYNCDEIEKLILQI
ncbi:hypothetical protein H311_00159 [Anncaliia algerae PRA109]|nr:hypothetical protein H311_00159 [Anncaliia algerae PRA109]